ncbi:MAG: hypothetical protein ACRYGR_01880, partial [Janthinobacterium lividum]
VGTAPLARYRLPARVREDTLIAPSSTNADGLLMLPMLAEIADRVAPWVAVHIVPRILRKRTQGNDFARAEGSYEIEGELYAESGGLACYGERLVLLQSGGPTWLFHSLCHELFHHLWNRHLSDAACDVLTAAVARGADWPGVYYASVPERVARLFEAWAWARIEGMPANPNADFWTVEGLFEWVWEGGLADHQIVRGLVRGHEDLMRRRNLQPLPPPEPKPLPAPPPRPSLGDVVTDWVWDRLADGVYGVGRGTRWAWRWMAAAA